MTLRFRTRVLAAGARTLNRMALDGMLRTGVSSPCSCLAVIWAKFTALHAPLRPEPALDATRHLSGRSFRHFCIVLCRQGRASLRLLRGKRKNQVRRACAGSGAMTKQERPTRVWGSRNWPLAYGLFGECLLLGEPLALLQLRQSLSTFFELETSVPFIATMPGLSTAVWANTMLLETGR